VSAPQAYLGLLFVDAQAIELAAIATADFTMKNGG
jgi:hypothetical protein